MVIRQFLKRSLLLLGCLAAFAPCYALDSSDLPNLKVGAVLTVADPKGETPVREISITHVHSVRGDGSVWYQINGTSGAGQEEVLYADLSVSPPKLETVVRKLNLRKLVDRPRKFLDAVEDDEKGELVMDDATYRYNDKESDSGFFEPDSNKAQAFEFNYLVFTSQKEAGTSIQVMRWDDEKFDVYLVKQIAGADVKLK